MQKLILDKSEEVMDQLYDRIRGMTPEQRLEKTAEMISSLILLSKAAVKAENPNATEDELYFLYAKKMQGEGIAKKLLQLRAKNKSN